MRGPEWLIETNTPVQSVELSCQEKEDVDRELKIKDVCLVGEGNTTALFDFSNYNSLDKLMRVTAYVLRLKGRHQQYRDRIPCAEEIQLAEERWTKFFQKVHFDQEIKALQ